MIAGYIGLGAWLLTLIILGFIVVSTGIPEKSNYNDDGPILIWCCKLLYLLALSATMYQMGEHFSNL